MKRRNVPLVTEASQAGTFSRRALVVGGAQATLAALLAGRMGYIAIAQNRRYTSMAEDNRVQERLIAPRRGWITDRYGQPIAINRSDYRVDIIPDKLEDKARILATLAELLGLAPEDVTRISEQIERVAGYQPVPVSEHLTFDQFAALELRRPELPGVSPLRSFSRYYPESAAVGHLVGYVGAPSREEYEAEPADKRPLLLAPGFKIGKDGLENTQELRLRGQPGAVRTEVTARGRPVRDLSTRPDVSGPPLHTTIDAGLQSYAARRAGDQSVGSVVLDIRTGDILAFVSMPSYDPNSFSDGIGQTEWAMMAQDERHPLINKVLQGLYPPGSTCKPMHALALLEAGVDPECHRHLQPRLPGRQPHLPLRHHPRHALHGRCGDQELRHLFLPHGAAGRDREADADLADDGFRPALRPALPAPAPGRHPRPRLAARSRKSRLAGLRHGQLLDRPGLSAQQSDAAGGDDRAHRQRPHRCCRGCCAAIRSAAATRCRPTRNMSPSCAPRWTASSIRAAAPPRARPCRSRASPWPARPAPPRSAASR